MAGVNDPIKTKNSISQTFNLREILGYTPTPDQKRQFYDLVVDAMVDRTTSGKDVNKKKFKRYSKQYAEEKGVTRNSVDLVLTGDMLNSFEEADQGDEVIISLSSDELGKAYGHISGFEGHPTIKNGPVRDFFGMRSNDRDLKSIIRQVDSGKPPRAEAEEETKQLTDIIKGIFAEQVQETNPIFGDSNGES